MSEPGPLARGTSRVRSLDGLRGLAALVVVVHHAMILSSASLAAPYAGPIRRDLASPAWWVSDTPLHLVWAGGEAVDVFFVLSGFVLVQPLLRRAGFDWLAYFAQRLCRLYVPVWGSLVLAGVLALAFHRHQIPGASWVLNSQQPLAARTLARDAVLLKGTSNLNGPLWSLRWEVVFSILLPVFVAFAAVGRRAWPLKAAVLGALMVATVDGDGYLFFLPIFGFGVLLAFHQAGVAAVAGRVGAVRGGWWAVGVAGVLLLLAQWWLQGLAPGRWATSPVPAGFLGLAEALGATLIVVVFWQCGAAVAFARRAAVQWLGVRSYSLYLVHGPILTSLALLLGGRRVGLVIALGVPLSLAVSDAFYRLVEGPGHRFSRRVGTAVARWRPDTAHEAVGSAGRVPARSGAAAGS